MQTQIDYPSSPASLFSSHARQVQTGHQGLHAHLDSILHEDVICPFCLGSETEYVGSRDEAGETLRDYYCKACDSNFSKQVSRE